MIFFLNDNDSAMSIATVSHDECQWSVRSMFCSCPCVNAVIHWYGRWRNTRYSSSTDAYDVKQVLKTFKSAFMMLLVQKEQHFSTTHHYFCVTDKWKYLKLYKKKTVQNSLQQERNISCLRREEEGWLMLVTVWWMKSRNGLKRLVNKLQNVMFSNTRMDCM